MIPTKFLKIAATVVIVAVVGLSIWYFVKEPGPRAEIVTSSPVATKSIHLTYPPDWEVASASTVRGAPSRAIIVLQRRDKSGVLVVLPSGKAPAFNASSSKEISSELAKEYADYKFVSAAIVHLRGKTAYFLTYLRTRQGDLHTITILPEGQRSFIIETASPSANAKLGVEIGKILKSATITSSG